jgi:hypothetical protein
MILLPAGLVVLAITIALLRRCMPRNGQLYRFANTAWDPYVGVAFATGLTLGCAMAVSGVLALFG